MRTLGPTYVSHTIPRVPGIKKSSCIRTITYTLYIHNAERSMYTCMHAQYVQSKADLEINREGSVLISKMESSISINTDKTWTVYKRCIKRLHKGMTMVL